MTEVAPIYVCAYTSTQRAERYAGKSQADRQARVASRVPVRCAMLWQIRADAGHEGAAAEEKRENNVNGR